MATPTLGRRWPGLWPLFARWIIGYRSRTEQLEMAAQRKAEADEKKLYAQLRHEAMEYVDALQATMTRLNICYRYKKSEQDTFERVQQVTFIRPYHLSPEVIRLKLDTRHLPRGISCRELEDEYNLRLLSVNCKHPVTYHHDVIECGYWLWIEREAGMGGIPRHIGWEEMLAARPATLEGERLAFPVGVGISRKPIWRTIPETGNLLIAGSPNAGKSNFANSLICTLLRYNKSHQLKLLLVDLKGGLEFSFYSGLTDYLLTIPKPKLKKGKEQPEEIEPEVEDDDCALPDELADEPPGEVAAPLKVAQAVTEDEVEFTREMIPAFIEDRRYVPAALSWLINEAERRMAMLKKAGCKKIQQYNQRHPFMPYIVAFVDEWADVKLDRALGARCEDRLINITNRARATGIYCYLATQSPNKDVLSIRVKNAMNSRMIFHCADQYMSQGLVGDYSASKIDNIGRGFWISGKDRIELQTPFLGDEKRTQEIVNEIKAGKVIEIFKPARHDVSEMEIFTWALKENNGCLGWRDVYAQFSPRKFSAADAKAFGGSRVGREFDVDSRTYRIAASTGLGGRNQKQAIRMLPVDKGLGDKGEGQAEIAIGQNQPKS